MVSSKALPLPFPFPFPRRKGGVIAWPLVMVSTDLPSLAVSRALAAELARKVREQGIVVWLDAEEQYTGLVDALRARALGFPYPVVAYRGSYLELMIALEGYGNDWFREHLLVHLPGLNKETVKETPVYELYQTGTMFERNLGTAVREAAAGAAKPEEIDAFVRAPGLTLDKADAWLDGLHAAPREGLTLLLESLGLEAVVLRLVTQDARLRAHLPGDVGRGEEILAFLERGLGLDAAWRTFRIEDKPLTSAAMASLVSSWLMAVEFVHDLREPPVTPELAALTRLGPLAKECRRLASRLRELHPDDYEAFEGELQDRLEQERTSHHARALGAVDTFRFEEAAMRGATLGALGRAEWEGAAELADERTADKCFWVRRDPRLQRTWEILRLAASTGRAITASPKGLDRCGSLEEAVDLYAEKLAPIDRKHRLFEQRAHALLASDLDDYDALLDARRAVRQAYRAWADGINRAFFALCVKHGPLPGRSYRQRTLYEEVVHPLVAGQPDRVAYFLVDALRFEMAQGLAEELRREKYRATLGARLAELPTETSVGMNVLAPVERNGRLRPVLKGGKIDGFTAGEFAVHDPATRLKAIKARSLDEAPGDLDLEELQDLTVPQLRRRLGKPRLVVVHSRELDTAGEHGLHLGTFDHTLALLKSAISLLAQAGVTRFVITSDHGFLLQDATAASVPFGASKQVPQRRHAILAKPAGMPDVLEVRLSALEYDAAEDPYLVFRPDTALWQTTSAIAPFVHGGNSLEERVIPVLVLERQVVRGKTTSRYEVVARAEPAHLGRQRLRVAVRLQDRENASLGFMSPRSVSLALRVVNRPEMMVALLDAGPPATLDAGRVLLPPNRDEALVEFEVEGPADEKILIEIYHPDAVEQVTPKVVEGFFEAARSRNVPRPRASKESTRPPPPAPAVDKPAAGALDWAALVADEGYRKVVTLLAERRSINEAEIAEVLGSPRRVRAFARDYDALVRLLPFDVDLCTVNGLKTYARRD